MKAQLSIVPAEPETDAEAIERMQADIDARAAALLANLLTTLNAAEAASLHIWRLSAIKPGIREECRQLASQISARAATIMAITGRGG